MKNNLVFCLTINILLICSCNRSTRLNVEITNCPKQIEFINTDFTDSGFTTYNLYHEGFCYNSIDSIRIIKEFKSGTAEVYLSETLNLVAKNIDFYEGSDNNTMFNIKLIEPNDTAENISARIAAIYENSTESNTVEFSYQTPCKRQIGQTITELIDTMSCNTTAGDGDRHLITFEHQGYCVSDIDSISVYGNFCSQNGYIWSSSSVLIPREKITFQENNTYLQKISFRLCITNNYADYVENQIYLIYKDGDKSNLTKFRIYFDYQNKKQSTKKIGNEKLE
jgi:hypothetical protein